MYHLLSWVCPVHVHAQDCDHRCTLVPGKNGVTHGSYSCFCVQLEARPGPMVSLAPATIFARCSTAWA